MAVISTSGTTPNSAVFHSTRRLHHCWAFSRYCF